MWHIVFSLALPTATALAGADPLSVVRGGQRYDKWHKVLDTSPPQGNHPLWALQNSNKRSGAST